jgi:hypothetical protein
MPYSDPEKRRAYQKAYYARWLARNRDSNNLVRRARYKYDAPYRERRKCLDREYRRRRQRVEVPNQ